MAKKKVSTRKVTKKTTTKTSNARIPREGTDARYRADNDARTLMLAAEIKRDGKRKALATKIMQKQVKDIEKAINQK